MLRGAIQLLLLAVALIGLACYPAQAQGMDPAQYSCARLQGNRFAGLTDAPATITTAQFVAANAKLPAHCNVVGEIRPHVGFGMWLPVPAAWNHKLLEQGCGGFCGIVATPFACTGPLLRGYACIQTDMGHKGGLTDATWAAGNLPAVIDFAYRSTHVTLLTGKALVAAFYGAPQEKSYFLGCSTGGRQGLVEAERFPADFDGISAIAPAINETGAGMQLLWSVRANLDARDQPILPTSKLPLLHGAVIAQCDMNDGVRDGLIGDPRLCHFDPARLQCHGADTPECLTAAQVAVARKIYNGPTDSRGRPVYTGGLQPGSELNWGRAYLGQDGKPASYAAMMRQFWRYLAFTSSPPASWDALKDFDFDTDPQRVGAMETLYTGSNPDLRIFADRGGKILLTQGWYDNSVVPLNTVQFYEGVTRFMGGAQATDRFFRLFMVPGMEHCTGGDGPWAIDYLKALDRWVTQQQAPDAIIAVHPKTAAAGKVLYLGTNLPLPAADIAFSRKLFPYPKNAIYSGHGDPDDAANFVTH